MEEHQRNNSTAFVKKLINILRNPSYYSIVRFNSEKKAVQICDEELFQKEVLPKYFRHGQSTSFYRQMNLYGFHKGRDANIITFWHHKIHHLSDINRLTNKRKDRLFYSDSKKTDSEGPNLKLKFKKITANHLELSLAEKQEKIEILKNYPPRALNDPFEHLKEYFPSKKAEKTEENLSLPPPPSIFACAYPPQCLENFNVIPQTTSQPHWVQPMTWGNYFGGYDPRSAWFQLYSPYF